MLFLRMLMFMLTFADGEFCVRKTCLPYYMSCLCTVKLHVSRPGVVRGCPGLEHFTGEVTIVQGSKSCTSFNSSKIVYFIFIPLDSEQNMRRTK